MATVSVILPTYNRAHTLRRALSSVVSQTHPADEIIVVDDGSTDETAKIVGEFNNVSYVRLDGNAGAANARNIGAQMASGDYLAFQDSDDVWLINKLEAQLEYLERRTDVGLLCSGITVKQRSGAVKYFGFDEQCPREGWSLAELQSYPFSTPTWLIRKADFIEAGMFDAALANCEDLDFLAKFSRVKKIEVIPEPLIVKYNQADSLDHDREKREQSYRVLFERHDDLWKKTPSAASRSLLMLANMHFEDGNMARGRALLQEAIRYNPAEIKAWGWLLISLLGNDVFTSIRNMRKGFVAER